MLNSYLRQALELIPNIRWSYTTAGVADFTIKMCGPLNMRAKALEVIQIHNGRQDITLDYTVLTTTEEEYTNAEVRAYRESKLFYKPTDYKFDAALSLHQTVGNVGSPPPPSMYGSVETVKSLEKEQTTNQEETKMTNRKIREVTLIDNSLSLKADKSLVLSEEIIFDGSDSELINEIIMTKDVKKALADHNELRAATVDEEILKRVGNEVMLRPVELKDLTWDVK